MSSDQDNTYRVLIVDDEPMNVDMLGRRLTSRGYMVASAANGQEALRAVKGSLPDVMLVDVNMPGMSGLELLDKLRADESTTAVPIILVSALSDTENIVRGLQRGANDYVTKPINLPVLLARIETHLKMSSLVSQLENQKEILAKLAASDDLTGIYNRRSLFESLEIDLARAQRYRHELTVLMMDLDHFKNVNDLHGHAAGDAVLRQFADRISSHLRSTDALFRYGGEEFCAVLPESNHEQGMLVAENLRNVVLSEPFRYEDLELTLTVSIGLSTFALPKPLSAAELLDRADKALYEAKNSGRNRVCCYGAHTQNTPWIAVS
ncbi:MAG: diguanylate cyclase [Candidatus Sumerlaeaceae bacterium]